MKEVKLGRYAGPVDDPPFDHFLQSPACLVRKDHGENMQLIFCLSYPNSGSTSVNANTPTNKCKVVYLGMC